MFCIDIHINIMPAPSNIVVELFYANWCPHCHDFMKTWDELKKNYGNTYKFIDYEEAAIPARAGVISGYPTIKITVNGIKKTYTGARTPDAIIAFIDNPKNFQNQQGGATISDEEYRLKYLKYKAKYLKLKSQRN